MKKLKLFLLALVVIPCAIVMAACGGANAEKQLKTEANCDAYGTYETSSFSAVETDLGTNAENAKAITKGFRMTMTSTNGTETTKVNVIAKQISETNYVMAMKTNENGVESYAYLSEGYLYISVNDVKVKVSCESSFFHALPFADQLNIKEVMQSIIDMEESKIEGVKKAIEGNAVKYEVNLTIGDYYLVFKNNSLHSMNAKISIASTKVDITYEVYNGKVSLPDLSDYNELPSILEK